MTDLEQVITTREYVDRLVGRVDRRRMEREKAMRSVDPGSLDRDLGEEIEEPLDDRPLGSGRLAMPDAPDEAWPDGIGPAGY